MGIVEAVQGAVARADWIDDVRDGGTVALALELARQLDEAPDNVEAARAKSGQANTLLRVLQALRLTPDTAPVEHETDGQLVELRKRFKT